MMNLPGNLSSRWCVCMRLESVRDDLVYLTGPETAGRLSGSAGAARAADYLAGRLAQLGLSPVGENGFLQTVEVPAARLQGPVRLTIGGVSYAYRRDFGEMAHLSAGGSVRSHLVVVNDGQAVSPDAIRGAAVLIPERPDGFDFNATAAAAADLGAAALLVEWGEPRWFHKTIFGSPENRIPVLRVRKSLAASLASQAGAAVALDLPLVTSRLPCQNVLGLLPGTNPAVTVALTAHYDHVGDDPEGERFPGALDNASGVATMLAVAEALVERRVPLPFNVLVGFLTGEESGTWGARHLAANPPVPLSAVINLDGMGLEPALRSIRLGYPAPGHWLADLAAAHFTESGTAVQWTAGGDDSVAFQAVGLPALGLGHMATEPLKGGVHSPDDSLDLLHLPVILAGAESILSLLQRLAVHPAMAIGSHIN
jgi:hypothetical protein